MRLPVCLRLVDSGDGPAVGKSRGHGFQFGFDLFPDHAQRPEAQVEEILLARRNVFQEIEAQSGEQRRDGDPVDHPSAQASRLPQRHMIPPADRESVPGAAD